MQTQQYEFTAELQFHDNMDAAYIKFPYNCYYEFGIKGQVKVKAIIDGVLYRGSLAKMNTDCHIMGITQSIRQLIKKGRGDKVHIILEKDDAERIIEIPEDLMKRFDELPRIKDVYEQLSYTAKKEIAVSINEAKKTETRNRRIEKTIDILISKIK